MSAGSGWTVWNLAELAGWLKGRWAQSAVNEPFRQNVHVFRAINVIIQVLLSLPIRVKRGDDEVTSGPAFELINRPTAGANKEDLIEEIAGHLLEAGEAHLFDPEVGNVRPREIIVAGRREMTPRFTADGRRNLLWWEYRETGSSGRPDRILPEQDSYTRLFNPYDKWRGMSPAEAFALGLQADALSQQHNVSTLKHGATPSGWLKFGQMLETNERDEYMQRLEERHRGADEAGKIGVLEGDVDWIQNQFSNVDLDLLNLRKLSREEAFEAYGVPPVMGAVFDSAHYNVADSAQEIMLWGSIAAYIGKIEGLFNGLLLPRVEPGVSLEIDLAQHPVLQRVERNKVAQFVSLVEHNVPAVLAAQWLDLPFDDVPHAKVGFMTSTVRTTDEIVEGLPALPPELPAHGTARRRRDQETCRRAGGRERRGRRVRDPRAGAGRSAADRPGGAADPRALPSALRASGAGDPPSPETGLKAGAIGVSGRRTGRRADPAADPAGPGRRGAARGAADARRVRGIHAAGDRTRVAASGVQRRTD
jgi:HK97 family phage portal protein